MAKQTGLGMACYVDGNDISGDVQQLTLTGGPAEIDVTDITQSGMARLGGELSGEIDLTVYMDPALAHPALSSLPTADRIVSVLVSPLAIGSPVASLQALQLDYDPKRDNKGALTITVKAQSDAFPLEWGEQLTAGLRTDTTATSGTARDDGSGFATPAVPASGVAATNTSPLPAQVVVTGGTVTGVSVNGVSAGTGDGTYVVPAGGTITLTYSVAPTWTWTLESGYGCAGYLHVTAFTGTSVDILIEDSPDNATWSTLIDFGAQPAAGASRVAAAGGVFAATQASPAVFTAPGTAYAAGDAVTLHGSALPGGFADGQTYYVSAPSGDTFELAATSGGVAINSSSAGSGTVYRAPQRYVRASTSTGTFTSATFAVVFVRYPVEVAF